MQTKERKLISCIIPFYNESERIISVLDSLSQVKHISKFICIDDGSADPSMAKKVKEQFPAMEVIRREKNSGKSAAIKFALNRVDTPYVFLFDADIANIVPSEIDSVLKFVYDDSSIDFLILRRIEPWYVRFFRSDILEAGERLLRTEDLRKVFLDNPPTGYMLEYATNSYMIRNHKKVFWVPYSGRNLWKNKKIGFFRGVAYFITLHLDFIKYKGLLFTIGSYLFFCRKEYKPNYL